MGPPTSSSPTDERWTLRQLPLAARLALAAFLISVGLGYFTALVNLHFQEATPGKLLPDENDVIRAYSRGSKASHFERLLMAHPSLPFNGSGSMRKVFTDKKVPLTKKRRKAVSGRINVAPDDPKVAETFYKELDGERVALIAWGRSEGRKAEHELNKFKLEGKLKDLPIAPEFVEEDDTGRYAKVQSILGARCTGCHSVNAGGPAGRFPLDDFEDFEVYLAPESRGKSLPQLALTTHVHLLSFSMLYGLTGLILALTSLPGWIRVPLAPLPLVAQVVDISFWWLARLDEPYGPMFAKGIMVTGGIVAVSLGLQILLTLLSLFGWRGRVVLALLLAGTIAGGYMGYTKIVDPYLTKERESMKSLAE